MDPVGIELVKSIGAPALSVLGTLWFYRKFIEPKANGKTTDEIRALTDSLAVQFKTMTQAQDLSRTEHFDQLRRDLTTTIEKQQQLTRDDLRNALATMTLELELGRLREGDK